eukprot:XP_001702523.1 predicted protein [Chlamydomonas reinhardtii]
MGRLRHLWQHTRVSQQLRDLVRGLGSRGPRVRAHAPSRIHIRSDERFDVFSVVVQYPRLQDASPTASLRMPPAERGLGDNGGVAGLCGSPDATANQQLLQEQRRQEQMVWMGELPLPLEMLAWCPGAYTAPVTAAAGQPSDGGATAASCRPAAAAVLGSNPCWARFACDDASTLTSLTAPFLCASLPAGAANPNTITDASIEITADGWYSQTIQFVPNAIRQVFQFLVQSLHTSAQRGHGRSNSNGMRS